MSSEINLRRMMFYLTAGMSVEQAWVRYLFVDEDLYVAHIADGLGTDPKDIRTIIREANQILDEEANRNTPRLPPYAYPLPNTGEEYEEIEAKILRQEDELRPIDRFWEELHGE